jgi:peroxin-19
MLDEFSAVKVDEKKDAPSASGPGRPDESQAESSEMEKEFAKKMEEGMSELLKELDEDPELAKQMEALVKGLQEGENAPSSSGTQPVATGEESFQETIRKTMERMQSSGEAATAAAADGGADDILAQLLKEMEAGGGGDGDEDLTKMFLNMMEQLTNKEMLYEPMKELNAKFPSWIQENRAKVPEDKMNSYEEQQKIVAEIVTKFEEPGYTDENPDHRQYIWERMQKV